MNNLLSDCGLIDAKIRASDKDTLKEKIVNMPCFDEFSEKSKLFSRNILIFGQAATYVT